jgi:hypothetical protein
MASTWQELPSPPFLASFQACPTSIRFGQEILVSDLGDDHAILGQKPLRLNPMPSIDDRWNVLLTRLVLEP